VYLVKTPGDGLKKQAETCSLSNLYNITEGPRSISRFRVIVKNVIDLRHVSCCRWVCTYQGDPHWNIFVKFGVGDFQ